MGHLSETPFKASSDHGDLSGFLVDATDISTFLESPKKFYWNRLYNGTGIVPAKPSIHLVFGGLWSEFVANFYAGIKQADAFTQTMEKWTNLNEDFPVKERDPLTKALAALIPKYYQNFSPNDEARTESEVEFVWKGFCGRVDGETRLADLDDGTNLQVWGHECKATSRASSLADQVWYYQNSIQIKLYAAARRWDSVVMEFAYKDPPYDIFRAPAWPITVEMRTEWEAELTAIRLGMLNCIKENYFLCNPAGCNIVVKKGTWPCAYKSLCEENMATLKDFIPRAEHLEVRKNAGNL